MKIIKKISLILIYSLLLIIGTGCKNFLTESDPSHYDTGNYYTKSSQAESAINAIYSSIYPIYNNESWMITLFRTGIANTNFSGNAGYPAFQIIRQLAINPDFQALNTIWDTHYRGIANANIAIMKIPNIKMDQADQNKLLGEARFLRAYYYFNLVRIFGGVPLIKTPVNLNSANLYPKSTSVEDIYNFIVDDLTTAEDSGLPFNDESGRVTLGAVKSLLSTVYLTIAGYPLQKGGQYYKLARDKAKEVIDSGAYHLFSSYDFLRNPSDDNTGEYIFEIQFNQDDHPSDALQIGIIPFKQDISAYSGEEGFSFVPDQFVDSYEAGDKRAKEQEFFFSKYTRETDRSDTVQFNHYYIYKFFNENAQLNTAKSGLNWPVIRYTEVLLNYAEASNEISGPSSETYEAVNKIRKRASILKLSGLTQSEFRKAIWKERYHEECFENKIWFLMTRTRKALNLSTGKFDDYIGHTFVYGETLQKRDLLFPIPGTEIKNNKNLNQNSGY